MAAITSLSASDETKVMARPLVPKRPARLREVLDDIPGSQKRNSIPDTMQVAVRVRGTIVVDDNVHALNINSTTENVGSDKNTLFKCLESGISSDTAGGCEKAGERLLESESSTVPPVASRSEC